MNCPLPAAGPLCAGRPSPAFESLEARRLLSGSQSVLTYHNDNLRTGANTSETTLTPANVTSSTFGLLGTFNVDGQVYGQPLLEAGVRVGKGHRATHINVLITATENDSVYAFAADAPGSKPLWHDTFINYKKGLTPVPVVDIISDDITPKVGITSTPVIDAATNTVYVVTKTVQGGVKDAGTYTQQLHALDMATGAEKFGGPVTIDPTIAGTGDGVQDTGLINYQARWQNQRCALTLVNGVVYVASSSHGDNGPYHGWVVGYSATTLQQVSQFNDTPDGSQGGIWMASAGLTADAAGNLYFTTGNGTFDANAGGRDYGNSFLKVTPDPAAANGLRIDTSFTPHNQADITAGDLDIDAGGVALIPNPNGGSPLAVFSGKEGTLYVVDADDAGGFNATADNIVEELPGAITSTFASPAYFNGSIYYIGVGDVLRQFHTAAGAAPITGQSHGKIHLPYPGATPSISANGTANAIAWAIGDDASDNAVLYAFSASDPRQELYDSNAAKGGRDQGGNYIKFSVPTVVDGNVFVGTQNSVLAYGLLPQGSHHHAAAAAAVASKSTPAYLPVIVPATAAKAKADDAQRPWADGAGN